MKVKKITAATMPEAMQQVRQDLGPDAVILESKEVNVKKWLGFFKRKQIVVFAALDPSPLPDNIPQQTIKHPTWTAHLDQYPEQGAVLAEIKHLKKMLLNATSSTQSYPGVFRLLDYHLREQDIDPEISRSIVEGVMQKSLSETDEQQIKRTAQLEIESRLKDLPFNGMTHLKKVIHFVGPTGVGKTTTLAKVAAKAMLEYHKQVAFITVDTYRIAAIDQLKTYAEILNAPVKVAYDLKEYREAIDVFKDYDLIFVDTAGRNFQSEQYVNELTASIDFNTDIATYLVLSLTAKSQDMFRVFKQFEHFPLTGLIMTKLDETKLHGGLLNMTLPHGLSIASLTNGQDVPDDIFEPTPEYIADQIMGGFADE